MGPSHQQQAQSDNVLSLAIGVPGCLVSKRSTAKYQGYTDLAIVLGILHLQASD